MERTSVKINDTIRILYMEGEPAYIGKTGIVERIDDAGQLHGTWGGLAIVPGEDEFKILESRQEES